MKKILALGLLVSFLHGCQQATIYEVEGVVKEVTCNFAERKLKLDNGISYNARSQHCSIEPGAKVKFTHYNSLDIIELVAEGTKKVDD